MALLIFVGLVFFGIIAIGAFLIGMGIYYSPPAKRFRSDRRYKALAEAGEIVLLTYEQYMCIHQADPISYPLDWVAYTNHIGNIYMLSKDFKKLEQKMLQVEAIKMQEFYLEERAKKVSATVETLTTLRNLLGVEIDRVNKETAEAVKDNYEIASKIIESREQEGDMACQKASLG